MKSLALSLILATTALPAFAENGLAWRKMDDEELKSYATIIQGLQIDPDSVFGESSFPGDSQLRVRTYPRGDQDLLIVESTAPKNKKGEAKRELIQSIQLKRVAQDGSVKLLWDIRHNDRSARPVPARQIQRVIEAMPGTRPGPTDVPESKFLRPMSHLEWPAKGFEA